MAGESRRSGMVLRLLGPAVEGLCLVGLMRHGGRGETWLGRPVEPLFYAGLGCGLAMVVLGLMMSRASPRRPREEA